ncbi:MAG: V-type ATPase subunit [Clostridia bacterium]|nr:V-type ATPase subunit [Clostridia bacterium]
MEKIYPYAVAKIKVKENRLLTNANLEQLAQENDIKRIVSELIDRDYKFDMVQRYEDYGIVLKKAEEEVYHLIREIVEENDMLEIFLSRNDYYNVKMILKSRVEGKEYQDKLLNSGTYPTQKIASILENKEYDRLDKKMKQAIQEAIELYEKTKMPFIIDAILDKACFGKIKTLANHLNNEFIKKYIEKLIDITNIKTFFRIRKIYYDKFLFEASYIEGGKITLHTFMENFEEEEQSLKYKFIGFSDTIGQAVENYESLDKFCDNYIMSYMKDAKLKSLTIEPILAFIYAKRTEFKNIRIILTGKLNNISAQKIKERLRESYV